MTDLSALHALIDDVNALALAAVKPADGAPMSSKELELVLDLVDAVRARADALFAAVEIPKGGSTHERIRATKSVLDFRNAVRETLNDVEAIVWQTAESSHQIAAHRDRKNL